MAAIVASIWRLATPDASYTASRGPGLLLIAVGPDTAGRQAHPLRASAHYHWSIPPRAVAPVIQYRRRDI